MHHNASSSAASAKRYVTEASGATLPSWKVIANQVEPQISVAMANSAIGLMGWRRSRAGFSGRRAGMHYPRVTLARQPKGSGSGGGGAGGEPATPFTGLPNGNGRRGAPSSKAWKLLFF